MNRCTGCHSPISSFLFGGLCDKCDWMNGLTDDDIRRLHGQKTSRGDGEFGDMKQELALESLSLELIEDCFLAEPPETDEAHMTLVRRPDIRYLVS